VHNMTARLPARRLISRARAAQLDSPDGRNLPLRPLGHRSCHKYLPLGVICAKQ
jgi:hypothetical protein